MLTENTESIKALRLGGALYLIVIVSGIYAEIFVLSQLIVVNDASMTAKNILSNELLFRSGIIAHLVTLIASLLVMAILFNFFKPVSKYMSVAILVFNTTAVAVEAISILYEVEVLSILKSDVLGDTLSLQQIEALAYQKLRMQSPGYDVALLFFSGVCISIGLLILKSKYFHPVIGILMIAAGVCYCANSTLALIAPTLRSQLLPFILLPCLIGELSLAINLIVGPKKAKTS